MDIVTNGSSKALWYFASSLDDTFQFYYWTEQMCVLLFQNIFGQYCKRLALKSIIENKSRGFQINDVRSFYIG